MDGASPGEGILLRMRFEDADDFAQALRATSVDYLPLSTGAYECELVSLEAGKVLLQSARDDAHVTHGAMKASRSTVLLPLRLHPGTVVNGYAIGGHDGIVLPGKSELHAFCPGPLDWAAVSLGEADFASLAEGCGLGDMGRFAIHYRFEPERLHSLQAFIQDLLEATRQFPQHFALPQVARAIESEFVDRLTLALSCGRASPARDLLLSAETMRIFRRSLEIVDRDLGKPIYTEDLCCELRVSRRTLHNAFVATCGLSPHLVLKRRRLVLVRRALKRLAPGPPLVKTIALTHGFWHLGHFARDYRQCFGESASETLARAGGTRVQSHFA